MAKELLGFVLLYLIFRVIHFGYEKTKKKLKEIIILQSMKKAKKELEKGMKEII